MKTIQLSTTQLAHRILNSNPGMSVARASELAARAVAARRAVPASPAAQRSVALTDFERTILMGDVPVMAATLAARRHLSLAAAQAVIVSEKERIWNELRTRDDGDDEDDVA